jgi:adenine specific DNA methylase Mod
VLDEIHANEAPKGLFQWLGPVQDGVKKWLIHGDNLDAMHILSRDGFDGKIDLVYIDPPFWSGEDYFTLPEYHASGNEDFAYNDRQDGGIDAYLDMMCPRLQAIHGLLSPKGSLFVHVDWYAGHYIKLLLDSIFGRENLRNEIIWYYGGPSPVKTCFPRKHDVIFFYSKSDEFTFNPQYEPLRKYLLDRARHDPDGRLWVDQNVGRVTERKFKELESEGRVFMTKSGRYRRKQFLDEMQGDMVDDVWSIPIINSQARERIGYPTQKPEALLERILLAASNPGDLVADFFCGSGTTLAVADHLGRQWIGVDASSVAITTARDRLTAAGVMGFAFQHLQS